MKATSKIKAVSFYGKKRANSEWAFITCWALTSRSLNRLNKKDRELIKKVSNQWGLTFSEVKFELEKI